MRILLAIFGRKAFRVAHWAAVIFVFTFRLLAQQPTTRITTEINNAERATISGSHSPMASTSNDAGRVSSGTKLQGMTLVFNRSAAQQADLQSLIAAQQQSTSSSYHKWLTPEQFAARFGMSDADIAKVESWLEQQGFSVDSVARSKTSITFSGTVGQAETAFSTELHYYKTSSKTDYAPSGDLSIPSALSSVVQTVTNLSSFRPRAQVRFRTAQSTTQANFTSSQSSNHYLTPADIATIYDVKPAYSAGYTGTGQSIAVVGQSSVQVSDIEAFQTAAGLTKKDPTLVLVPNTGSAAVSSGDEAESDLDLEYSGAIATGATIYFVYVGNNTNYSTFDALQYAVDTDIAPIISNSYGTCETNLSSSDYNTLDGILAQGAVQGQSIITASGDNGSTDCYGTTGLTTTQQEALAVDFPASSEYVTAMGGTEFPADDIASSNTTYWQSASGSDVISSALSYIPEQAWNDDSSSTGLASGGGGTSALTTRPTWQSNFTGIPSGSNRLVPDISLSASPNNAGYLYCSSDSTSTGITGSCSNGFRDSNNVYLTVAGGTSFDAPIFAGMLALINQKQNSTRQGVINSTLYTLAANSSTYVSAFHDISGDSIGNKCNAGSSYCSSAGASEYATTAGYDQATGLGSVDLYNLLTAWPASSTPSLQTSTTALAAATTTPAAGASDVITITVSSNSSAITATPTGTLTIKVDGTTSPSTLTLSNGTATYSFTSATSGAHVIQATYSGDATYAASTGTLTVNVGGTSGTSSGGTFTLSAPNVTVSQGSSGTSTVTVTSQNSYAGTVGFTMSTSSASLSTYGCYDISNATLSANSTATTTLTIYTSQSACSSTSSVKTGTQRSFIKSGTNAMNTPPERPIFQKLLPAGTAAFAGLLLFGNLRRRTRLWSALICFLLVGIFSLSIGCGGSSTSTDVAKGTYTLTLAGTDTSNSSIAASTTLTLTVQ